MKKHNINLAICMFNAEKYIAETLQCIIDQTYQNFDLLIINDCSTDNSVAVVESFFSHHSRRYDIIHLKENQGLCAGRLLAEKTVKTKYLLFVDSDDCPYPTLVEKLYAKISSDPDLMAVGCYLEYMDSKGGKINGGIFIGETTKEDFYEKAKSKKLIFMQPTAIYNREIALSVGGHHIDGFPEGKPRYRDYCEDLDLWTRMSDLFIDGKAIVVLPEVLCRYRKHEQALSSNAFGMNLRMKHIKTNLLRRRAGDKELSFVEFYNSLSNDDLNIIKRKSVAADSLRNGVFKLKKGSFFAGGYLIFKSITMNPKYFWQKIKSNSGILKKNKRNG